MKALRIVLGLLVLGLMARYAHPADIKISALPDGGTIQTTDQVPVNRAGTTSRVVVGALAAKTQASLTADVTGVLPLANILTCSTDQIVFDSAGTLVCNAALTFTTAAGIQVAMAEPRLRLSETDQGADLKNWDWDVNAGVACLRTRTDADAAGVNVLCITRGTGTAITNITQGNATNNPSYTLAGTGNLGIGGVYNGVGVNVSGSASAARYIVTASTVPANGIYLPTTNTLGFATNTTAVGNVDATGDLNWTKGFVSIGTKPTVTGCTNSGTLGGAVSGSYVSGTTGTCTVTIPLPSGPTNAYACFAHDDTTAVDYTQSAIVTTVTTLTISGTTVTGDKIVWGCMGY
jgi:hypothetical protein